MKQHKNVIKETAGHLKAVEEVVPDDDDGTAAGGPSLARRDGLDTGDGRRRVQARVQG